MHMIEKETLFYTHNTHAVFHSLPRPPLSQIHTYMLNKNVFLKYFLSKGNEDNFISGRKSRLGPCELKQKGELEPVRTQGVRK